MYYLSVFACAHAHTHKQTQKFPFSTLLEKLESLRNIYRSTLSFEIILANALILVVGQKTIIKYNTSVCKYKIKLLKKLSWKLLLLVQLIGPLRNRLTLAIA